jgi:hypothetical protein
MTGISGGSWATAVFAYARHEFCCDTCALKCSQVSSPCTGLQMCRIPDRRLPFNFVARTAQRPTKVLTWVLQLRPGRLNVTRLLGPTPEPSALTWGQLRTMAPGRCGQSHRCSAGVAHSVTDSSVATELRLA